MRHRLALELAALAVVGAVAGVVAARAWLPSTLPRANAPDQAARAPALLPLPAAEGPALDIAEAAPATPAAPPRSTPPRLARAGGRWRFDARGEPDALAALLTALDLSLTAPDPRDGGFPVGGRDRAGYLAAMGVRRGDALVALNDRPTLEPAQLRAALLHNHASDVISLRFRRGDGHYNITFELVR